MAVIQGMPPQATSNADAETAPEADVTPGTITIPATTICEIWATMSQAQALGSDGDRVLIGQRGAGSPRPESLIGLPAPQPQIRDVMIPVDSPRYTNRDEVLDIFVTFGQDCSPTLRSTWLRTIRPRSLCCMDGEEVRIDHVTREFYSYPELRSILAEFEDAAVL